MFLYPILAIIYNVFEIIHPSTYSYLECFKKVSEIERSAYDLRVCRHLTFFLR